MKKLALVTLLPALCAVIGSSASAAWITFENVPLGPLSGGFSEGGFDFSIESGGFENLNRTGTGSIESSGGISVLDIEASDGSDFEFAALSAGNFGTGAAQLFWRGWLDGGLLFQELSSDLADGTFENVSAFPGVNIDLLSLMFGPAPSQDEVLGSIMLETIASAPAPGTLGLLLASVVGFGVLRRRIPK